MADFKLTVIAKPEEGSREIIKLAKEAGTTIIRGGGSDNLLCGDCGTTLGEGVARGSIHNIVLYCNQCESYNDIE